MKEYDFEEEFHAKDKKIHRKERKIAQRKDRSKFKKTDQDKRPLQEELTAYPLGRVIAITGEGITVDFEEKTYLSTLKGALKKEVGEKRNLIAVGDFVRFSPDERAIYGVAPRKTSLGRVDITGRKEQLIAVNVDQVIIVVSLVEPPLKPALVDRYLIAAEMGGLHPIIVINKVDLLEGDNSEEAALYREFLLSYEPLGVPILSLSVKTGVGVEALRSLLQNKTSVFSGQSGVGKSSILNACFHLTLKTGDLTVKTQKGAHTTTMAELLPLPGGGYSVDTPGIRSFGIWNVQKEDVLRHFRDISEFSGGCKYFDCLHLSEPECSVLEALKEEKISEMRYLSYKNLLTEALLGNDKQTWS